MNQSPSGNSSSLSCPPYNEHQSTSTTIQCTTTFTSTRLHGGSHETATASTWFGLPLTTHHTTGEWSQTSFGSHGCRHGQAIQLHTNTMNEKHKIQRSMEPVISQEFGRLANGIGGRIKFPPTLSSLYSNTKYQQNGWKTSQMSNLYQGVRPKK